MPNISKITYILLDEIWVKVGLGDIGLFFGDFLLYIVIYRQLWELKVIKGIIYG